MLKKIMIVLGVIAGLFVVTAIALPFFIDADKYRPQIEKLVEENMNADLDLGKLSFSLWGGLHIEVEKMILSEKGSQGARPIVALKDAKLEIPIMSVFTGRPDITFEMKNPEIHVVSGPDGKLNVAKLAKSSETPQNQAAAPTSKHGGAMVLPFKLGFRIENGKLIYADLKKNTKTEVDGINFDLRDFALNKPFSFSFDSDLNVKEMKDLVLHGPAKITGTAGIYMGTGGFEHADLQTDVDLSGLVVRYGNLFDKAAEAPLKISVKLSSTEKNLKIDKGHFQIEDAAVDATGTVDNFDAPVVDMSIASSNFIFDHWQKVLGPLHDFDMKGAASFDVKVHGPVSQIGIDGKATARGISLKAPGIVPRITDLNSQLNFSNDTATLSNTSLKMGDSDLAFNGTVKNFARPVIVFNVNSHLLNVDSLLPQKTPAQQKAEAAQAEAEAKNGGGMDLQKAAEGPIAALKKNPVARALDFTSHAHFGKIIVHKAPLENLDVDLTFKDLVMNLKKASAKTFGGSANFTSMIDFRGADPAYSVAGDVAGVDINNAVTSQVPTLKDSVFGKIVSKFEVSGAGLSKAKTKETVKGKGNFRIDNGSWSALAALKQIGDKLKSLPGNLSSQLGNINISDRFREMKADFTIARGEINIVNLVADLQNANVAVMESGPIDFDLNENLQGRILAGAQNLNDVAPELKTKDGRLSIPHKLGCKLTAPCPSLDMQTIVAAQSKYTLRHEGSKAIKKALQDKIKNPAVQDLLNKISF